jgi:hypothetical protein
MVALCICETTMNKFEMTPDGYQQAVKWLKENNLMHLVEKEQSTDGYTIVALANELYAKKNTD